MLYNQGSRGGLLTEGKGGGEECTKGKARQGKRGRRRRGGWEGTYVVHPQPTRIYENVKCGGEGERGMRGKTRGCKKKKRERTVKLQERRGGGNKGTGGSASSSPGLMPLIVASPSSRPRTKTTSQGPPLYTPCTHRQCCTF